MHTFTKAAIVLSLAAAGTVAASVSLARTGAYLTDRPAAREARAQAQGRAQLAQPPYGYGYWPAPDSRRVPSECIVDEGYGRTSPCSY